MITYNFRLSPFQNLHLSEEEVELRFNACLEDAKSGIETATVTLEDDILSISVVNEDDLSVEECLGKFKSILVNGSLSLFAERLF